MGPCVLQVWAARRQPRWLKAPAIWAHLRAARLACRWCLLFWLLVLAVGCATRQRSSEYTEVSGTVFYKGKPLPGGRVTFITVQGAFASSANIEENGHYKIQAPVGDVQIGVDNSMFATQSSRPAPKNKPTVGKRPGAEEDPQPLKGRYVEMPSKYASPDQSGLTYKVEKGSQTHDIKVE